MSTPRKLDSEVVVFWFRRDLRLMDNAGLSEALAQGYPVLPVFIFDREILSRLKDSNDRRVQFIHQQLMSMQEELKTHGSALLVETGSPEEVWRRLLNQFKIKSVYCNHDYEPYALARDESVQKLLAQQGVEFKTFKDQVIFEKSEVVKDDSGPYTVYTPYSRKWKATLTPKNLKAFESVERLDALVKWPGVITPSLSDLGFAESTFHYPTDQVNDQLIRKYADQRDRPEITGTSHLGLHLRFGTVSIRQLVRRALQLSDVWLSELIWREFFMQILWHFPHVGKSAFRKEYDKIKFRNDRAEFQAWCEGRTGYPLVDAGMRELNATGFMHNRVRMVAASFLVKHLLIDWRWGEAYFAEKLLDFDFAANNGNWQWVAGSGCDAAPYFRVFNPHLQEKKFDPQRVYIKRWVPEVDTPKYPEPIVDHAEARVRVLAAYGAGLGKKAPAPTRAKK